MPADFINSKAYEKSLKKLSTPDRRKFLALIARKEDSVCIHLVSQ